MGWTGEWGRWTPGFLVTEAVPELQNVLPQPSKLIKDTLATLIFQCVGGVQLAVFFTEATVTQRLEFG